MTSRKKNSSPVDIIDLCQDDDDDDDDDPSTAVAAASAKAASTTTTTDDRKPAARNRSSLSVVRKRVLATTPGTVQGATAATSSKKVKVEDRKDNHQQHSMAIDVDVDEEEVEVIDAAQVASPLLLVCPPVAAAASASSNNNNKTDEDVQVVGTKGQVRLPHLRQDCTENPFKMQGLPTLNNSKCCNLCFCYVCDAPWSQCTQWTTGKVHCNASNKKSYWKNERNYCKEYGTAAAAAAAAASSSTTTTTGRGTKFQMPAGCHFYKDCPQSRKSSCESCFCYICDRPRFLCDWWSMHRDATDKGPEASKWMVVRQKVLQDRKAPRVLGSGPFPPVTVNAYQDTQLTVCRKCGWFNRFDHNNFEFARLKYPGKPKTFKRSNGKYDIHPLGSLDWCHACGRVASERDFGKEQSQPYSPAPTDILLGTKSIPFRLKCRDPRRLSDYKARWEKYGGKSPGWVYSEKEMQEELFRHRIGEHPTLTVLLSSIPLMEERKIPSNEVAPCVRSSHSTPSLSLLDMEAVLVAEPDLRLLDALKSACSIFGSKGYPSDFMNGDITAAWNGDIGSGTLTLRVFIKKQASVEPVKVSELFGTWFGVYPLPLSQVCSMLHPQKYRLVVDEEIEQSGNNGEANIRVFLPPFVVKMDREKLDRICKKFDKSQKKAIASISGNELGITLQPGSEMAKDSGGICTNETDFAGIMKRFASAILPDVIGHYHKYRGGNEFRSWLEYRYFGRTSNHRMLSEREQLVTTNSLWREDKNTSILSPKDLDKAVSLLSENAASVMNNGASIDSALDHLVNLGHASAPLVNGLTVELLPFQLQSLKWALEREQTPGGVQSFWWAKLPHVQQPNTELYYNPIIGKFSTCKPTLVRGGFLGEQMGMGKTVISLSLILSNPAPAHPASGSAAGEIPKTVVSASSSDAPSTPFWDPDMKFPDMANKKRGSILCRGTLVVCPVSLVGQWVDEAKSKLKEPGLVYSYYGAKRKRDPLILSKNSIVVTTYETLASDATYHAKKGGSDYCAPCEQVRWWRIICDESHCIRNATSKTHAVMNISADHKWLVSGTPLNTTIGDLSNQLKFLGVEDHKAIVKVFHDHNVCHKNENKNKYNWHNGAGVGLFQFFMRSIMMRHTQNMKYAGTSTTLMSLPPKTEKVVTVPFSAEDQKEYDALETAAQTFYQSIKDEKGARLGRHYLALKQKLIPLRIACSGGQVPIESDEADNSKENEDNAEAGADHDLYEGMDETSDNENVGSKKAKTNKKPQAFSKFAFTSKLHKLVKELKRAREKDSSSKSLVFSQFKSTLEWLQQELPHHGFQFRTLSGEMTMSQRAKALREFQNDPPTTVFLLSMRAGAVGINLTQANRVFILEPCLNPAIEAQAIGRVHRLGQKRPVKIVRFIMQDSVEARIREMLEKKYGSNNSSDDNGETNPPAAAAKAVIGCLQSERTKVLTSEFDLLYGMPEQEAVQQPKEADDDDDDVVAPDTMMSLSI